MVGEVNNNDFGGVGTDSPLVRQSPRPVDRALVRRLGLLGNSVPVVPACAFHFHWVGWRRWRCSRGRCLVAVNGECTI